MNDVLLAALAGGLRAYLTARGVDVDHLHARAAVPAIAASNLLQYTALVMLGHLAGHGWKKLFREYDEAALGLLLLLALALIVLLAVRHRRAKTSRI